MTAWPHEIAEANAGLRIQFAEKSLVQPRIWPGVARLSRSARAVDVACFAVFGRF